MAKLSIPMGWDHVALDEVDSTNAEALRRSAAGHCGPSWITARLQTAGRGRSGRTWSTPSGNLAATLLFAPGSALVHLPELALVAGVAVHQTVVDALGRQGEPHIRLKWPNDVLIRGAKVSGILIETTTIGGQLLAAVGIGINVVSAPELPDRAVTWLAAQSGIQADFDRLSATLARSLHAEIETWAGGRNFAAVRERWLARSVGLGQVISVNTGKGGEEGRFAGLDADGGLLLELAGGEMRKFSYGDVALVASAC